MPRSWQALHSKHSADYSDPQPDQSSVTAKMKPDTLLINTARGGIVNETDLASALRAGEIGGARIDVLTREPPDDDHPLLADNLPNLLVSPHNAWGSVASRQWLANEIAALIRDLKSSAPCNICLPA